MKKRELINKIAVWSMLIVMVLGAVASVLIYLIK